MDEITGPVCAITLVLSSVFIPCCFLGGVTGQFFRQFAVTIAVSTIISAINALTMTPSRAVLIFKAEEGKSHHRKEALPWWSVAIDLGIVTAWLLPQMFGGQFDPATAFHVGPDSGKPSWVSWLVVNGTWFAPGFIIGLPIGWFIIQPVNAVLGWLFRGFDYVFNALTSLYGWTVGRMLRLSVIVLLVYGGLLVLTYIEFDRTPTGFIPQQDKGYVLLNVQLPDSASLERTQGIMAQIEKIARATPGVEHTVGVSGRSLILDANAPNLGSMYVMLKPFDDRHDSSLRRG